jgi:hypothetical protein
MISTTASTMRYCTSRPEPLLKYLRALWLIAVLLLCWSVPAAYADNIVTSHAELQLTDGGYQVIADFGIKLDFVAEQALTHGIPLYFTSEFSLTRPRWYWLDEEVAHSEQSTKLSYNILTRQFRITRGGLYQNFDSLKEALGVFGHQVFPPIPISQVKPASSYVAAVRMSLDVSQLPKPLQVNALATKDWDIDSGWHRWTVRPDTAAME